MTTSDAQAALTTEDIAEMVMSATDKSLQVVQAVARAYGAQKDVALSMYTVEVNGVYVVMAAISESHDVNDAIAEQLLTTKYH